MEYMFYDLHRVEIDDVDQTSSVTRADKGWGDTKTVTFESNAVKLRVCGSDHYPPPERLHRGRRLPHGL